MARGTPRPAICLLERARDVAQLVAAPIISVDHVDQVAEPLGIVERFSTARAGYVAGRLQ